MKEAFAIAACVVFRDESGTMTMFPDGLTVHADHAEQPGQAETAARMGLTVSEMNRTHDLIHAMLAEFLGLPHSPTIRGLATGRHWPHHKAEEAAVLAVQAYAKAAGVDLAKVAKKWQG